LDKHKAAAGITDAALKKAVELAIPGADIYTICQTVDDQIEDEVKKTFNNKKNKKIERGIAFPTTVSVNNIMGHYSPLKDESSELEEGDVAKIMCGAHFDGFAAVAGFTVVVGGDKVTGRKADVVLAAQKAMAAAQRVIREGATNTQVTEAIAKVSAEFDINPIEGVLSHKMKKHIVDGNDVIINKETATQQVDEYEFIPGDVFGLDIVVSTGEGKTKEAEERCTVYKREINQTYQLKLAKSRAFFVEMDRRFPTLPFSIRGFKDQIGAKVAVKECSDHDLLIAYPVLQEKPGEIVAQFFKTIAVLPRSTTVLCGDLEFQEDRFTGEHSI